MRSTANWSGNSTALRAARATCWLHGAGTFGDFSDDTAARTAGDFALNLANAEVGGRGKRLDLTDDALLGGWPAQMLSPALGGPHAGGHTFAYGRERQFGMAPIMMNIARPIGLSMSI